MILLLLAAVELTPARVDHLVRAEWQKAHVTAGPRVDDARYLRRIWLDLAGVVPPPEEVRRFLADRSPDKRARAVDALLGSPRYADHFTDYWDGVLMGRRFPGPFVDRGAFRRWLHEALYENRGWNQIAYELVAAVGRNSDGGPRNPVLAALRSHVVEGDSDAVNGATNWLLRFAQVPQDIGGTVSRIFLGVRIQCAQCHDHPSEKWTQKDFQKFGAIFARSGIRPVEARQMGQIRRVDLLDGVPGFGARKDGGPDLAAMAAAKPTALDGADFSRAPSRRIALAAWMVAPENPWFARAFVNRMWAYFLGRGFVEPVDDFRRSNPAVAQPVLDALAADFVAHGYDIKRLVRLICATEAYQRAAAPGKHDLWQRYRLRPLSPEQLLASIVAATDVERVMAKLPPQKLEKLKLDMKNAVVFLFDVDEEAAAGDDFEGTIPQALMLMNGELVNRATSAMPDAAVDSLLKGLSTEEEKVDALYLRTLSRLPSADEKQKWLAFLAARPAERPQAVEDLFWALVNSSEFVMRH